MNERTINYIFNDVSGANFDRGLKELRKLRKKINHFGFFTGVTHITCAIWIALCALYLKETSDRIEKLNKESKDNISAKGV